MLTRRLLIHVLEGLYAEDLRRVPLALISDEVVAEGVDQLLFGGVLVSRDLKAAHELAERLYRVVLDLLLDVAGSVRILEDLFERVTLLLRCPFSCGHISRRLLLLPLTRVGFSAALLLLTHLVFAFLARFWRVSPQLFLYNVQS